jgi:hypothetical protein
MEKPGIEKKRDIPSIQKVKNLGHLLFSLKPVGITAMRNRPPMAGRTPNRQALFFAKALMPLTPCALRA